VGDIYYRLGTGDWDTSSSTLPGTGSNLFEIVLVFRVVLGHELL
jgi:hypothetical protein